MGRRKTIMTRRERIALMERQRLEHNEKRKKKYGRDNAYRQKVCASNRDRYRTENAPELRFANTNVNDFTTKRRVFFPDGTHKILTCLDYTQMADFLGGYHKFVLHRWHRTHRFPRGNHTAQEGKIKKAVYLPDQARALSAIMREHQKEKLYLTERDVETIRRLFQIMA